MTPLATKLAEALENRSSEIVGRLVATYRQNPGYQALDADTYEADLLPVATANERLLCRRLRGLPHNPADVRIVSESAVRRFAQGVPESEVMRAYRLWSMAIWTELTEIAQRLDAVDTEELVALAAVVLEHNEFAGGLAADAYEAEQHGIWIDSTRLPQETAAAIFAGTATEDTLRRVAADHLPGKDPIALLLVAARGGGGIVAEKNHAVRAVVADWRRTCGAGSMVLADGPAVLAFGRVAEAIDWTPEVAEPELLSVAMAISADHPDLASAVATYGELTEVLRLADMLPPRMRPFTWQDTLFGSIVNSAPPAVKTRLAVAADDLFEYEQRNSTPLLHTFGAYLESELSVSTTAEALFCHPNTVRYRLSRIQLLTGLDPRRDRDRSILSLALALRDIGLGRR
ncbi:MAG: helix-turn-helix domain-containing protein [Actinobacteria bacterium]|nr:helix-turn-helix domain-containing protein [Actinomycetota bacterium]